MTKDQISRFLSVALGKAPGDILLEGVKLVEVFSGRIIPTRVLIYRDRIAGVGPSYQHARKIIRCRGTYLLPGLIDGHIHIESSLLGLPEFARLAVRSGTTAVVADPHEIANVLGIPGVDYMIRASRGLPLDVFFTAPSCVPATTMETAGAVLGPREVRRLLKEDRVVGLAEMMNFPGVLFRVPDVLEKIEAARAAGKVVDGHSPGLSGPGLSTYAAAGVQSDHECTTMEEARERLEAGMMVMMREGSAAKNLKDLIRLVNAGNAHRFMLVSDDRDCEDLREDGHVNSILRRAVQFGLDPVTAVRMATINPATYFNLKGRGAVAPGYRADLVLMKNLRTFAVERVFKDGRLVMQQGRVMVKIPRRRDSSVKGSVRIGRITPRHFRISSDGKKARVIEIVPDQIITRSRLLTPKIEGGEVVSDPDRDILKLGVVERHGKNGKIGLGLVKGLGLKKGVLASTVAHDSHNLILAGVDDRDLAFAAMEMRKMGGGYLVVADKKVRAALPLPIAGLMSDARAEDIIQGLKRLNQAASGLGCRLSRPFSTLSFLALPVIPELKLTDNGLVDVKTFQVVSLFP